jgi:hypothetical protein
VAEDSARYEEEKNRVIEERQKQIESVTPAEKRKILKMVFNDYSMVVSQK